jgi:hypothetical protein
MYKESFPVDRDVLRARLPEVLTALEIKMPIQWNTAVMHILNFHNLDQFEMAGPYVVCNLMEIERYHTQFKNYARGRMNLMASIKNHHSLMEASEAARLENEMDWTLEPPRSSVSGLAARLDCADRAERVCNPLGKSQDYDLDDADYQLLQTLWADSYPVYLELHKKFNRQKRHHAKRGNIKTLATWMEISRQTFSAEETNWAKMTPEIKVRAVVNCACHASFCCHAIFLSGMLFSACYAFSACRAFFCHHAFFVLYTTHIIRTAS